MTVAMLHPTVARPKDERADLPKPAWVYLRRLKPHTNNGESLVAGLLPKRSKYEPWQYELPNGYGFRPDFWVPQRPSGHGRTGYHVEVTWLDFARAAYYAALVEAEEEADDKKIAAARKRFEHVEERWARKLFKIEYTERHYGVPVVLVTYDLCQQIEQDPIVLHRLIDSYLADWPVAVPA